MKEAKKGFTLIELLIIIGIIGFLAAAILVAVDPVGRIQDSRDAKRWSEVNAILNAILTKQVDDRRLFNGVSTAPILTTTPALDEAQVLVKDTTGIICTAAATRPGCGVNLNDTGTVTCVADVYDTGTIEPTLYPNYLAELPVDSRVGDAPCSTTGAGTDCYIVGETGLVGDEPLGDTNSGYYIKRTVGNRIEIGACAPEQATAISVKR